MGNKYTGFEKLLKEKLGNFEYPYDNKEWLRFEKKLPKSSKSFYNPKNLLKFVVIPAAVIISTVVVLYLNKDSEAINRKDIVTSNSISENTKNVNEQITNDEIDLNNNSAMIAENSNDSTTSSNNSTEEIKDKTDSNNKNLEIPKNNTSPKITEPIAPLKKDVNPKTVAQKKDKNINQFQGELINADITEGCAPLKINFKPLFNSDTILFLWSFGDGKNSTKKTVSHVYSKAGTYTVSLTLKSVKSKVSRKVVFSKKIIVKASPKAKFESVVDKETDVYTYSDKSESAINWLWSFGDKYTSKEQSPNHEYLLDGTYNVKLIVSNAEGCMDTSYTNIKVTNKRPFNIPNGYNPTSQYSQYFGPSGSDMNPEGYKMCIYNEAGKMIFKTTSFDVKWDGKIAGTNKDAPLAAYIWIISMKNKNGILQEWTGYVTLIR